MYCRTHEIQNVCFLGIRKDWSDPKKQRDAPLPPLGGGTDLLNRSWL